MRAGRAVKCPGGAKTIRIRVFARITDPLRLPNQPVTTDASMYSNALSPDVDSLAIVIIYP